MKNLLKTRIGGGMFAMLFAAGICAAADGVQKTSAIEKTKVTAEVTEISIEAGTGVSITFVKTANTIGAEDIINRRGIENPVTIEKQGTKMVVKIKGEVNPAELKTGPIATSLKLLIPQGKTVAVSGGSLVLSGDLSAKNVTVQAAGLSIHACKASVSEDMAIKSNSADMKMEILRARKLDISVGELSGSVKAPASTQITGTEGKSIQIIRKGK